MKYVRPFLVYEHELVAGLILPSIKIIFVSSILKFLTASILIFSFIFFAAIRTEVPPARADLLPVATAPYGNALLSQYWIETSEIFIPGELTIHTNGRVIHNPLK